MGQTAKEFWERVYEVKEERDITLHELSSQSGLNRLNAISAWRDTGRYPRAQDGVAIAKTLGTTLEYLVTGDQSVKRTYQVAKPCAFIPAEAGLVEVKHSEFQPKNGSAHQIYIPHERLSVGNLENLRYIVAKGDDMVNAGILHGDLVVYEYLAIDNTNDLYVVKMNDSIMPRRLEFNSLECTILVRCDNPNYSNIKVKADEPLFMVLGKIVAVLHIYKR